jgi:hypothetical protein
MHRLQRVSKWLRGDAGRASQQPEGRRCRPLLESLESRLTPSGDVTAMLTGGNLSIIDHAASSTLTLSQPAAHEITITPDAGTTINGKAGPVTISGVTGNLDVDLGAGKDTLTFDLSKTSFDIGSVSITGTSGDKTVTTDAAGTTHTLNVTGSYREVLGTGTDFTQLHQFEVSGNMTFDHANGAGFVFLGVDKANLGKMFNKVGGALTVANVIDGVTGTGSDVDALEETNVVGNITAQMGSGDQNGFSGWTSVGSLSGKSVSVGGSVNISAPSGFLAFGDFANDGEEVVNANVAGNVTMNLGTGANNTALFGNGASASSTSARNVTITGTGTHDAVTMGPSAIAANLGVRLSGAGSSASLDDVSVGGTTNLSTVGGGGSIAIDNQTPGSTFAGNVNILMQGGNNLLAINSHSQGSPGTTTFAGTVSAQLGDGGDTLVLAEAGKVDFDKASRFNGGPGTNQADVNNNNISGVQPTLVGF